MRRNKTILLTRTSYENELQKEKLNNCNIVELSMLNLVASNFDWSILNKYQTIIITSKYALQLLPNLNKDLLIVGEISAQIAREKSYDVKYVAKNAFDLYQHLVGNKIRGALYLCSDVTSKWSKEIKKLPGIDNKIIYNTLYKSTLNEQELDVIKNGVDVISIYSENCAKTLCALIDKYKLHKYLANAELFVISSKVAKIVKPYFIKIHVAIAPELLGQEMLEYVTEK